MAHPRKPKLHTKLQLQKHGDKSLDLDADWIVWTSNFASRLGAFSKYVADQKLF
jgi:hypothetical protein